MSSILAQNRSFEEHKGAASNGQLSPLEAEAIGLFVQLNRMVGHPPYCSESSIRVRRVLRSR